jgi:valyl-tRNA synthetase
LDDVIDVGAERNRLNKEMERAQTELASAEKRLSDSRFLERAPAEIVEGVKRKRDELSLKLKQIEQSLAKLPSEEKTQ